MKQKAIRESMQKLDWSIPFDLSKIRRTIYKCQCGTCKGKHYLITWDNIVVHKWYSEYGACPITTALRLGRIALMSNRYIPDNIVQQLLEIAK